MAKAVARFEKVSFSQFKETYEKSSSTIYGNSAYLKFVYDNIKLPKRSTKRSSGYDFFYPGITPLSFSGGKSILIPTGIRCVFLEDGYDLTLFPRSSMGFKYRAHLDGTVGIIDNDYFEADNEGHIMVKLSCDPRDKNTVITINPGDKFVQGIFREYFLAEDDDAEESRIGGIGSTGK